MMKMKISGVLFAILLLFPVVLSARVMPIYDGKLINALNGNGQDITGLDDITLDAISMTGVLTNTNVGTNLDLGVNGGGDTEILFYDDDSDTQRSWIWDDSNDDWYLEDDTGAMRKLWHDGNTSSVLQSILVDNTIFVDAGNGNDGSCVRERADLPCATIGQAKTIATTGDTITVRSGVYDEVDIGKNNVNYFFEEGASILYDGTSTVGIFDDGGSAMNISVRGFGVFTRQDTGTGGQVVDISNASSDFNFICESMSADDHHTISWTNGVLKIRAQLIENVSTVNTDYVFEMGSGNLSGLIDVEEINRVGNSGDIINAVSNSGGRVEFRNTRFSWGTGGGTDAILIQDDNIYFVNCQFDAVDPTPPTEVFTISGSGVLNIEGTFFSDTVETTPPTTGIYIETGNVSQSRMALGKNSLDFREATGSNDFPWNALGTITDHGTIVSGSTFTVSRLNDSQVHKVDSDAGAGAYELRFDMENNNEYEGLFAVFLVDKAASTNPTIRFRDGLGGSTIFTINNANAEIWTVILYYDGTNWIRLLAVINDV